MAGCEVRLSGAGGQGLILSARILAEALVAAGKTVAQSQSYEPTSRGGLSRADLVIDDDAADYPLASELDYLVILDQCAVGASRGMIKDDATVVADARYVTDPPTGPFRLAALPLTETAARLGSNRVANIVALGALIGLSRMCDRESLEGALKSRAPKALLDLNLEALNQGYELAAALPE